MSKLKKLGLCFILSPSLVFSMSNFETLQSFSSGTGFEDDLNVALRDSKLYITTKYAGNYGNGELLTLDPNIKSMKSLHSFDRDMSFPRSTLVFSKDGKIAYGVANNKIYKLSLYGTDENNIKPELIHEFKLENEDGYLPVAVVLDDDEKKLFGITSNGGKYHKGTFFKIDLTKTSYPFTMMHSFTGRLDGDKPISLSMNNNTVFGVTSDGGSYNCGTIFKVTRDQNDYIMQTLAPFEECDYTNSRPIPLSFSSDGKYLFGGNQLGRTYGGQNASAGYIYRIDLKSSFPTINVIYRFKSKQLGPSHYGELAHPTSLLPLDETTLVGTSASGGENDCGTIFKVKLNNSLPVDDNAITTLHEFNCGDGNHPYHLIKQKNHLYGETIWGGTNQRGTIFRYRMNTA